MENKDDTTDLGEEQNVQPESMKDSKTVATKAPSCDPKDRGIIQSPFENNVTSPIDVSCSAVNGSTGLQQTESEFTPANKKVEDRDSTNSTSPRSRCVRSDVDTVKEIEANAEIRLEDDGGQARQQVVHMKPVISPSPPRLGDTRYYHFTDHRNLSSPTSPFVDDRGSRVIGFGKHRGSTFRSIVEHDRAYCKWALQQRHPSAQLRDFVEYLYDRMFDEA